MKNAPEVLKMKLNISDRKGKLLPFQNKRKTIKMRFELFVLTYKPWAMMNLFTFPNIASNLELELK